MIQETNAKDYCLHIAGASHHLSDRQLKEWMARAVGSTISIIPDPSNLYDPHAVGAWTWVDGRITLVGYVGHEDLTMAHRLLLATRDHRVRMKVLRRRENGTTLLACAEGITPVPQDAVKLEPEWTAWHSPMPDIPMPQQLMLETYIANDIVKLLHHDSTLEDDELHNMLKEYIRLSYFDLSLEARQQRGEIIKLLKQRSTAHDFCRELNSLYGLYGRVGTETDGGKVWERWMKLIRHPDFAASLANKRLPAKADVDSALRAFPLCLFDTWLTDRRKFVARLYYACIPRHVLWQFTVALAFHEIMSAEQPMSQALQQWAGQAYLMPDRVLTAFYETMQWLADNDYGVSPSVTTTLAEEIKKRRNEGQNLPHKDDSDVNLSVSIVKEGGTIVRQLDNMNLPQKT